MELFEKKYNDAQRALSTLREILKVEKTSINRDASIQRFEYTTEAVWKCLQTYLKAEQGIDCYSPKACLREAKNVGLLNEEDTSLALQMIDDRNATWHAYHEGIAENIYGILPRYLKVMDKLLQGMKP